MKQFILMNAENGDCGVGVRVQLFDDLVHEEPLMKLENCSLVLRDANQFDGWLVKAEEQEVWIYATKKMVDDKLEVLGEL